MTDPDDDTRLVAAGIMLLLIVFFVTCISQCAFVPIASSSL